MKYELKETLLCLENVDFSYENKLVLKDVNLLERDVYIDGKITGQSIAIVGRSGRGKSTLLNLLSGLLKPQNGRILINNLTDGIDGTAKIVEVGDVSLVDQKYTLFRHKTVKEILLYSLRKSELTEKEKLDLINEYLLEWGIKDQINQYSSELSGGQRQRVAILSKILTNNTFLIMDEPISGLDPVAVKKVKSYINKFLLTNELNTIIFSTHDLSFAVEMADVIYVVGFPDVNEKHSTIVKKYDLKELGLAWEPFSNNHVNLVKEIENYLETT